jgi:quinol monooxygenase YgiN
MSFHAIVHFEPRPGKADEFRDALLRVNAPSREEPGCISLNVYESVRGPITFAVHSEWVDEAAFELHAQLPHTVAFLEHARTLVTHEVLAQRLRQIGGGRGAGASASLRKPGNDDCVPRRCDSQPDNVLPIAVWTQPSVPGLPREARL